jgi:predicted secreted acid phosphatase
MQQAIIVDLDGTLANSQHVKDFTNENGKVDWPAWMDATAFATVNDWCREIVHAFAANGTKIIFLTARNGNEQGRKITEEWLRRTTFADFELLMRKENDYRPDTIIKSEIYLNEIAPRYEVLFAVDDKKAVIDMWRNLGVPALHCADY